MIIAIAGKKRHGKDTVAFIMTHLIEGDVVVDTPQGRYVKKGSVASAKIKARRSFRDHKDKKAITSRIATPIERKYLQRKDEG